MPPTYLPRTGATELAAAQGAPEPAVNEMGRYFDANASRAIIEDRDLATPPGTCADGACYLVAASPTGLWSSKAGKMAIAVGANAVNGWLFQTVAAKGFELYVRDEDIEIRHDGATWGVAASTPEPTDSEMWTGTSTTTRVTPRRIFSAAVTVSLTDGATITIDGNTGINFKVTLGGSRTLANPTNMKTGQSGIIIVTQDGTGGRTFTYGTNWLFPGGQATGGVLSTAAAAIDVISYYVRSDGKLLCTLSKAFAA